jgi:Uma2 family endonuclease
MNNLAEQKRYTYADYAAWKGDVRYEIIDGIPYAMASPSQAHQRITKKLVRQLDDFLRGRTCEVFHAPLDVRLNADSFDDIVVQPDIFVVCDESKRNGKSVKGAPDLVIEILSPYNIRHDTFVKFRQYQKSGVKEYWIVDPIRRTVEVYILRNKKYGIGRVYRDDDIVPVYILDGCKINLAEVFYDSIEIEDDDETEIRNRIIQALKVSGVNMSDEQIEQAVKILETVN